MRLSSVHTGQTLAIFLEGHLALTTLYFVILGYEAGKARPRNFEYCMQGNVKVITERFFFQQIFIK